MVSNLELMNMVINELVTGPGEVAHLVQWWIEAMVCYMLLTSAHIEIRHHSQVLVAVTAILFLIICIKNMKCFMCTTVSCHWKGRVATGQEKVKFFFQVRKNQHSSGKLEKINKSQENVRKNTKFSFKIQFYLQFHRYLFIEIFQHRCAHHNFHFGFCANFNFFRNGIFQNISVTLL